MKQTAELVKKCQERMKSIRDKNYFTLRFGKTKMYSEKPFKKINMKQTAVEFLFNQLDLQGTLYLEDFEQAKEMEKEHIIQARTTAPIIPTIDMIDYVKEAEQYYNETFKSE
jgi:hypothetical protein